MVLSNISEITNVYYINLDSRPDRKIYVEEQLSKIGLNGKRFNAIRNQHGAIGCSLSHLKLLMLAKQNNLDHIMIVEDDIEFTKPKIFIEQLNKFLKSGIQFDVCLLGGNNIAPYERIDNFCVKIQACQTTIGYLVYSHYYDTLIENYKESIKHLIHDPHNKPTFAIDRFWFSLQRRDKWYLIIPLTITQREDYSDIEQRRINYNRLMLDLDKKWLR
jgi:glycosyl transferase, family 25